MADMIKITIDGKELTVPSDYTVLKAAEEAGIYIPRLCFLEGIHEESSCRVCVVEIEGQRTLKNSCKMPIHDGMVVRTNTKRVKDSVRENLELTAANHVFECWACSREENCELLDAMRRNNVKNPYGEDPKYSKKERIINGGSHSIFLDSGKCILCGRCISACQKKTGLGILAFNNRGSETVVGPAVGYSMEDAGCIYCGACIHACPTAAIAEVSVIEEVQDWINDPEIFTVVQAAPAVRAALAEEFDMGFSINAEGKMYAAFEKLGFNDIADVNYGADLTIMEEGTEFIHRLENDGVFPMFTSCSPGWVRHLEFNNPELLPHLSSCKSPNQMTGAIAKHYYADKIGVNKENMRVISVMPCTSKKSEINRPEMEVDGLRDVDASLTTRELARMIKLSNIDFVNLEPTEPKGELAAFTGAGAIFGATGGVMEAALRTVKEVLENKPLEDLDLKVVRGLKDIREATLEVAGKDIKVAVVHGGVAIDEFITMMKEGKMDYHFVEFMGCTGGCVNGGGQPIHKAPVQEKIDVRALRAKALYNQDASMEKRKSHENEQVQKLYKEFLGEPGSHKAHKLLHTKYAAKELYAENK